MSRARDNADLGDSYGVLGSGVTGGSGLTAVGALNAGSITSGFTSIDVGAGAITTTGAIAGGTVTSTGDNTALKHKIASQPNIVFGNVGGSMELQTTSNEVRFGSNNATIWYVNYEGATNSTITHYNMLAGNSSTYATMNVDVNDTSDRNLKEDIVDIPYGLNAINQLRPTKFKWKGKDQLSLGFIAQETQPILPELVTQDGVDFGDGKTDHMFLKYQGIIAVLCKAIQELSVKVTALENA